MSNQNQDDDVINQPFLILDEEDNVHTLDEAPPPSSAETELKVEETRLAFFERLSEDETITSTRRADAKSQARKLASRCNQLHANIALGPQVEEEEGDESNKSIDVRPVVKIRGLEASLANLTKTREAFREAYKTSAYLYGMSAGKSPGILAVMDNLDGLRGLRPVKTLHELEGYCLKIRFEHLRDIDGKKIWKEYGAPTKILSLMLAHPDTSNLRPLSSIVRIPTLTDSGKILMEAGYDEESRIFSDPGNLKIEPVSETPTLEDVKEAKALIDKMFVDFPFVGPHAKSAAVACLLEQIVRHSIIKAPCPMFVADAPDHGTGKSLVVEEIQQVIAGHTNMHSYSKEQEEVRKTLLPLLDSGEPMIIFDNVNGKVDSPHIARLTTAQNYGDRVLGQSKNVSVPNRATIVFTSNGARFSDEINRRVIMIELNKDAARTDTDGYGNRKYDHQARVWVKTNRARIIRACLVLAKSWLMAGKPADPDFRVLDSFEEWSAIIPGILRHVGYPSLETSICGRRSDRNDDREWAADFVRALYMKHHTEYMFATDIGLVGIEYGLCDDRIGVYPSANLSVKNATTIGRAVLSKALSLLTRWPVKICEGEKVHLKEISKDPNGKRRFILSQVEELMLDVSDLAGFPEVEAYETDDLMRTDD